MSQNPSASRCMFKQLECKKKGREEEWKSENGAGQQSRNTVCGFQWGLTACWSRCWECARVCETERERAASSLEACGEQRRPSAKIILLKTEQHQGYCLVSSRIREPAAFLKHLSPPWKTSSKCSVCVWLQTRRQPSAVTQRRTLCSTRARSRIHTLVPFLTWASAAVGVTLHPLGDTVTVLSQGRFDEALMSHGCIHWTAAKGGQLRVNFLIQIYMKIPKIWKNLMLSSPAVVPVLSEMLLITVCLTHFWFHLLRQILTQFGASSPVK